MCGWVWAPRTGRRTREGADAAADALEFPDLAAFSRLPPLEDFVRAPCPTDVDVVKRKRLNVRPLPRPRSAHAPRLTARPPVRAQVLSRIRVGSFVRGVVRVCTWPRARVAPARHPLCVPVVAICLRVHAGHVRGPPRRAAAMHRRAIAGADSEPARGAGAGCGRRGHHGTRRPLRCVQAVHPPRRRHYRHSGRFPARIRCARTRGCQSALAAVSVPALS